MKKYTEETAVCGHSLRPHNEEEALHCYTYFISLPVHNSPPPLVAKLHASKLTGKFEIAAHNAS
jgi:hypothetical protein